MPAAPRRSLVACAAATVASVALALAVPHGGHAALAGRGAHAGAASVRVSEGFYPVTRDAGPYVATSEPCPISLARRSPTTALDALESARRQRCVSSYVVETTAAGPYLTCVNGRCEATGFYWAIYLNGALTCGGLGDVVLAPGDELTFSFESYPTALALATCA